MADKKFFGNDKVYVETEYDNVVVIDPNKVVNSDGTVEERNVKQENLITYANLEARVIPRTKLAIGSSYGDSVKNVGVAQLKVNFMEGNPQNQKEPNVNLGGKESEDPKYFRYLSSSEETIAPSSKLILTFSVSVITSIFLLELILLLLIISCFGSTFPRSLAELVSGILGCELTVG